MYALYANDVWIINEIRLERQFSVMKAKLTAPLNIWPQSFQQRWRLSNSFRRTSYYLALKPLQCCCLFDASMQGAKVKSAWWSLQKDLALPLLPICIKKGTEVESSFFFFFFRSKHSGQKISNKKNWSFKNVNQKLVLHQWVWNKSCLGWFQEVIKIKLITRSLLRAEILSNNLSTKVQVVGNFDSFPHYFEFLRSYFVFYPLCKKFHYL